MEKVPQTLRQIGNKVQIVSNLAVQRTLNGIEYNIYPCILLVEGVHHGVGTNPVFYSAQTLRNSAPFWNNVPVTIGHPVVNGNHVLCNDDGTVRQQFQVGHVTNAHYDSGKLKGDLWVNTSLAEEKSPGLLTFLESGGELDVSTGLLAGEDGVSGTWNEETYNASILEIIPDHLALLPNATGACSWEDGCGVRVNQGNKKQPEILVLEANLQSTVEKVRDYIDSLDIYNEQDGYTKINFVRAVYSSYFVYEENDKTINKRRFLKQNYSLNQNEEIVIEGTPVEVVENITYTETMNESHNNSNKGEKQMANKVEGTCCPEKVKGLIANENNSFTGDDKDWLESLNETQLEKLVDNFTVEPDPVVEPDLVVNSVGDQIADYLKDAPPAIVSFINEGMKTLDDKRKDLITKIVNHDGSKFNEEQLTGMETSMLDGIANMIPSPIVEEEPIQNYGLTFPAHVVANSEEEVEPYVPTTLAGKLGKKE